MQKVKITRDTVVRFEAGAVLEVSDREAARLLAFKCAEPVVEPKAEAEAPKPAKKKKTK